MPKETPQIDEKAMTIKMFANALSALDPDRLTKQEIQTFLEEITKIVKKLQQTNLDEVSAMKQALDTAMGRMESNNGQSMESIKSEIMAICDSHMKQMMASHDAKMAEADAKMDSLTDGKDADEEAMIEQIKTDMAKPMVKECVDKVEKDLPQLGTAIRDGLELLEGDERLDKKAIKGLDEMEKRIDARISSIPRGGFGGGRSSNSQKYADLSSQTNGTLKVFSVPKNLGGVLFSSDSPIVLMENNGFTLNASRTQLTMTTTTAPSSGSQLLFSYISIFN